jgi:hypothetical protein
MQFFTLEVVPGFSSVNIFECDIQKGRRDEEAPNERIEGRQAKTEAWNRESVRPSILIRIQPSLPQNSSRPTWFSFLAAAVS